MLLLISENSNIIPQSLHWNNALQLGYLMKTYNRFESFLRQILDGKRPLTCIIFLYSNVLLNVNEMILFQKSWNDGFLKLDYFWKKFDKDSLSYSSLLFKFYKPERLQTNSISSFHWSRRIGLSTTILSSY